MTDGTTISIIIFVVIIVLLLVGDGILIYSYIKKREKVLVPVQPTGCSCGGGASGSTGPPPPPITKEFESSIHFIDNPDVNKPDYYTTRALRLLNTNAAYKYVALNKGGRLLVADTCSGNPNDYNLVPSFTYLSGYTVNENDTIKYDGMYVYIGDKVLTTDGLIYQPGPCNNGTCTGSFSRAKVVSGPPPDRCYRS